MALVATIKDGQVIESASQTSLSGKVGESNSSVDKDSFLQLLVAQMQYQDPLEPTSNTEYIAQYAQFTQVEEMQNMASNMNLMRASSLVGQNVYVKTTGEGGDTKYIQGKVDYVVYENGKAYMSIDEALYSIDDLDTIVDEKYQVAYDKAYDFTVKLNKLPTVSALALTNGNVVDELEAEYESMDDYQKTFIAKDTLTTLNKYIEKLKELRLAKENEPEEI